MLALVDGAARCSTLLEPLGVDCGGVGVPAAGDSLEGLGAVDPSSGMWYLRDPVSGETTSFYYGNPGDYPMMGDWDCDGVDTPGLYRQSDGHVYLRNRNSQGVADSYFFFGNPGDVPLAGDFNGDGCDAVSVFRPPESRVFVINELGSDADGLGAAEFDYVFGNPGDSAFVGDFDGDGVDTVGLHRESTGLVYFRNDHTQGNAHVSFVYGNPDDKIIAGKWTDSHSQDTVGIFRPSLGTFFLSYTNQAGNADESIGYGNRSQLPVAGHFGILPGGDAPPLHQSDDSSHVVGPVYAIGDSVMRGVACNPLIPPCYSPGYNLENQISDLESNASVSRPFRDAAALITSRLSRAHQPNVIIVHLGTNGSPTDQDFAELMEAAIDVQRVLVMTVKQSNTANEAQTNLVIWRNVPLYDNAELVDWWTLAAANPSWLAVDTNYGAHLWTDAARRGYVDLIATSISDG